MPFSIGNLLTLLIVFLVLALYRRLDRQNRSLEKVKRYSDNVLKNLNGIVEEKTAQIRDMAIELQVNLKTGKEVLKRIKDVEDGLQVRAGEIEGIGGRISEYDRVLKELVDMTSRVEENLKRVRQESLFVDKVGKRIRDSVARLSEVEKAIPEIEGRLSRENQERLDVLRQEASRKLEERVGVVLREVKDSEKKVLDFSTYVTRLEARREELQQESESALKKCFQELDLEARARGGQMVERVVAELDAAVRGSQRMLESQQARFEEVARQGEALELEVFGALKSRIGQNGEEIAGRLQELERQLQNARSFSGELAGHIQGMKAELEEFKRAGVERIDQSSREVEGLVFGRVEQRLEEYEGEVEYRFKKLEEIHTDVGSLETSLRQAMEKVTVRLQQEFDAFGRLMNERYEAEKQGAVARFAALQAEMETLAKGLQDLKAGAYQTASEQLQVFEDDFFSGLKKKSLEMDERVQEWQNGLESRIADISQAQAAARQSLEKVYQQQLKEGLVKLKSSVNAEIQRIETQAGEFEKGVRQSIGSVEGMLQEQGEGLRREGERVERETRETFQAELARLREELAAQMKKTQRETADRLREIGGELDSGKKTLEEQFETTRTETAIWQTKLLQLMKEAESGLNEKLAAYRLEAESSIAAIRDSFANQREDLIVSTNEERLALKNDLKGIADRTAELERELAVKTEGALKSFAREQEGFQMEFKRAIRDLQVELEGKVRDLRGLLGEVRERAEEQQRAIFGRIDESTKVLTANLGDIDKRLKSFIAQTKIFERADSLRITLEGRIDEMKNALKEMQAQRKEVQEIGGQLAGNRKMAEDLQARLARFAAERRRIEDMDTDFRRLLTISQDVDLRVQSLQSSQDALQAIQAKIHDLENLEKVIETRYDRLEKKKGILDSTTEGVDRSFQLLENLGQALKALQGDVQGFSRQAAGMKREVEMLITNREKADAVIGKLGELDRILGGLEERISKFETSREWLARTETRFEQVSREAEEQVALLQSILKKEAAGPEKEKETGAPPLGKREQVIKLAHQGWSSREIAKVTKLSRGEVELILELAPRS